MRFYVTKPVKSFDSVCPKTQFYNAVNLQNLRDEKIKCPTWGHCNWFVLEVPVSYCVPDSSCLPISYIGIGEMILGAAGAIFAFLCHKTSKIILFCMPKDPILQLSQHTEFARWENKISDLATGSSWKSLIRTASLIADAYLYRYWGNGFGRRRRDFLRFYVTKPVKSFDSVCPKTQVYNSVNLQILRDGGGQKYSFAPPRFCQGGRLPLLPPPPPPPESAAPAAACEKCPVAGGEDVVVAADVLAVTTRLVETVNVLQKGTLKTFLRGGKMCWLGTIVQTQGPAQTAWWSHPMFELRLVHIQPSCHLDSLRTEDSCAIPPA